MGRTRLDCKLCGEPFLGSTNTMYCSKDCKRKVSKIQHPYKVAYPNSPCSAVSGAASELVVATDLLAKGYYVFRALASSGPFDLIAYKDGRILKIEVKTAVLNGDGTMGVPKHHHNEHDTLAAVWQTRIIYHGEQP